MKLLVADDDPLIGPALQAVLEREGYEVLGVATAPEKALRLASQDRPDLALIDFRLGSRCGLETALQLRQTASVPSVIITGHHLAPEEVAGVALGILRKPFPAWSLVQTVQAVQAILNGESPTSLPRAFTPAPGLPSASTVDGRDPADEHI